MIKVAVHFIAIFVALTPLDIIAAQQQVCDLLASDELNSAGIAGTRVSYLSKPYFGCSDGTEIRADSSITYEATGLTRLIGDVYFLEGTQELHSDEALYYSSLGRLNATGRIEVEDRSKGSFVTGDHLSLLQENQERPEELMTINGTPAYATMSVSTAASPSDSKSTEFQINAKVLHFIGDRMLQALGSVEVERDSLELHSDSLELFQDGSITKLFFNAVIEGSLTSSGASTNVKGDSIYILFSDDTLKQIQSIGTSEAIYDNGSVYGSAVTMFFENDELETILSTGNSELSDDQKEAEPQALAITRGFTIMGDSIELSLREGRLLSAVGVGTAKGISQTQSDTRAITEFSFLNEDWIEGDTVSIEFSQTPSDHISKSSTETGDEVNIETMTARGGARSFFRRSSSEMIGDSIDPAAMELSYVRGDEVRIFFSDGEVRQMEVDNAQGSFLQPILRPDTISSDSTRLNKRYREHQ